MKKSRFQIVCSGILLLHLLAGWASADSSEQPSSEPSSRELPPSNASFRNEKGVHYGAPLRLSAHVAHVFAVREDTFEHIEGPELIAEAGLAGLRAGFGWARRGNTYYNGQSLTLTAVRTFETVLDPLAFPSNHTLMALGYRIIGIGLTLRGEVLYDLDARSSRWGLGWSAGVSW